MNPYNLIFWQDEVKDQNGNLLQEGTLHDEVAMNRMEKGIDQANVLAATILQSVMQHKKALNDLEGEVGEISLTNSEFFPFNNSVQTVALKKNRDTRDYRVIAEIISSNGIVGELTITDKQLNGFKIAFSGSAKNVTIKYYVQGGMYQ